MSKKRDKPRNKGKNSDNALQGGGDGGREDVIARLLQSQSQDAAATGSQRPAQPMIQDATQPPARPKFEMPDLSSSASLLARVQSFLPQLQQANTSLPTDHAGSSGFELVEENSDDEEDEDTSNDIKHTRDSDSDDDDDDSGDDDDTEAHPQIVMNLALGVFEEKKPGTEDDDSSSSEDSSDVDDASKAVGAESIKESRSISEDDRRKPESGHISLCKSAKPGKKPLIEEMS